MEERMEPKKEEVGVRLDDSQQGRVAAYAEREGLTLGEAISALLYLGLEFAERQRTGLKEDIEDLQHELLAEGQLVADEEWQGQLAARGLLSPAVLTEKLEG